MSSLLCRRRTCAGWIVTEQRMLFLCTHNSSRTQLAESVHDLFVNGGSWTF